MILSVIILGTRGGRASIDRNGNAFIVEVKGTPSGMNENLLFECHDGTFRQILLFAEKKRRKINVLAINKLFISHLHEDNVSGVLGLFRGLSLMNKENPLEVYGPPGTERRFKNFFKACLQPPRFEFTVNDLEDQQVLDFSDYEICVAKVDHKGEAKAGCDAFAYAFVESVPVSREFDPSKAQELRIPRELWSALQRGEEVHVSGRIISPDDVLLPPRIRRKPRKLVYSGDTRPCQAVRDLAKECDVLVHDSTFSSTLEDLARKYGHSTAGEAARVARDAGVGALILFNVSGRHKDKGEAHYEDYLYPPSAGRAGSKKRRSKDVGLHELVKEARSIFRDTYLPEDFTEFAVGVEGLKVIPPGQQDAWQQRSDCTG